MSDHAPFSLEARRRNKSKPSDDTEERKATQTRAKARNESEASSVDEDASEDGDDILASVRNTSNRKTPMLFIVAGVALVSLLVFLFVLFGSGSKASSTPTSTTGEGNNGANLESGQLGQNTTSTPASKDVLPEDVGTQDFTQNTNMTTSNELVDPEKFVEDLYGLTTRVDYTVSSITNVADFVSYTKNRGTWGGGLELYWLDVDYKGRQYVVQVPFQYYKELDDVGIVPVKMEVLTIAGSTESEKLTVISYMCLDEEVLEDILKSQSK